MSLAPTLIVKEASKLDREQFEIPKKKGREGTLYKTRVSNNGQDDISPPSQ